MVSCLDEPKWIYGKLSLEKAVLWLGTVWQKNLFAKPIQKLVSGWLVSSGGWREGPAEYEWVKLGRSNQTAEIMM